MREPVDVAVIGAGFGGLACALSLAERGRSVRLLETLSYPGGCASTFQRRGARFESGATLFSGFGPGQLFDAWIAEHGLDVQVDFLDPVVTLRGPGLTLAVPASRARWVDDLARLAQDRGPAVRALFAEQGRVADVLWSLFRDPALLPPLGAGALIAHARRAPRYLTIAPWLGRPLEALVAKHGLSDFAPLTVFLDAVSQITVQASAAEAEAPFAMATMDYFFRGTGHVRGGIGRLASALAGAIEAEGGEVSLTDAVKGLERTPCGWRVHARRGAFEARTVVANLLPQSLRRLLPADVEVEPRLRDLARDVETGWGAVMLYRVLAPSDRLPDHAHHLELVADPGRPFVEGNHVFCSISDAREDRAADGGRTVTFSTHVAPDRLAPDPAQRTAAIQDAMRRTIASLAPELARGVRLELPASPRTFERFTGRHRGLVGGVPRRAGLQNYRHLWPGPVAPSVYLVGDSVFPGQSTLACALGGVKLADHLGGGDALSLEAGAA